jgi:hypothetical protein
MRKTTAAILSGFLSCSTVVAAEPAVREPARRRLVVTIPREEIRMRVAQGRPFDFAHASTVSQAPPPDNRNWMERHPVWFGLIAGAGAGAAIGAASCGDGCFPIGTRGAAMVGSWYGAPVGALIGWGAGRAK